MTSFERRFGHARPLSVAVALFLIGQSSLVFLAPMSRATTADAVHGGVVLLSADSYGYIANGATWSGVGSETWNRWAFLTLIRIGEYLGSGPLFLVIVQALLLTASGAAVFDLARRHSGPLAGYLAASVILVNPLVSQWVRFVLTEATFYSLIVFAVWAAERVVAGRGGEASLIAVAVAITMTRPNGVLVGAACLTALVAVGLRAPLRRVAVLLVWATAAGVLVAGLNDATPRYGWDTATYTIEGVVIEGAEHARTSIAMPEPTQPIRSNRELILYAVEHPTSVGRLALTRIFVETVQIRRHYPSAVNLAVGLFMAGYLVASAIGLVMLARTPLTRVSLLVAVPLALLVGGTFAVPEGRFGWAFLIAFSAHAGVGGSRALEYGKVLVGQITQPRTG